MNNEHDDDKRPFSERIKSAHHTPALRDGIL
jgi:hypothetical protein